MMAQEVIRRNKRNNIIYMLSKVQSDIDTAMHKLDHKLLDEPTAEMFGILGAGLSAIALGLQKSIELDIEENL